MVACLYRFILVAAVFALSVPIFAPLANFHVAEWFPYHDHLFVSATTTKHIHTYDYSDYQLRDSGSQRSARTSLKEAIDSGVVYLTSSDGASQDVTSLASTSLQVAVVFPAPDTNQFLLMSGEEEGLPPEAFVPPPRRPPRV